MLLISLSIVFHTTTTSCLFIALNSGIRRLAVHIRRSAVADVLSLLLVLESAHGLVDDQQRLVFRSFPDVLVSKHDSWTPGKAERDSTVC